MLLKWLLFGTARGTPYRVPIGGVITEEQGTVIISGAHNYCTAYPPVLSAAQSQRRPRFPGRLPHSGMSSTAACRVPPNPFWRAPIPSLPFSSSHHSPIPTKKKGTGPAVSAPCTECCSVYYNPCSPPCSPGPSLSVLLLAHMFLRLIPPCQLLVATWTRPT